MTAEPLAELGKFERYLVEEFYDDYRGGEISRRTFVRRLVYITGSMAAAATTMLALGCSPADVPDPAAPVPSPDVNAGESLARVDPIAIDVLQQQRNVATLYRTQVGELLGNEEGLSAVRLTRPVEGSNVLRLDSLFVEIGADPRSAIAAAAGAELDPDTKDEVRVDRQMLTNVSGLFALAMSRTRSR